MYACAQFLKVSKIKKNASGVDKFDTSTEHERSETVSCSTLCHGQTQVSGQYTFFIMIHLSITLYLIMFLYRLYGLLVTLQEIVQTAETLLLIVESLCHYYSKYESIKDGVWFRLVNQ